MVYNGHREMALVLAVKFPPKKTSPGCKVAVNSNLPYLVDTACPLTVTVIRWNKIVIRTKVSLYLTNYKITLFGTKNL